MSLSTRQSTIDMPCPLSLAEMAFPKRTSGDCNSTQKELGNYNYIFIPFLPLPLPPSQWSSVMIHRALFPQAPHSSSLPSLYFITLGSGLLPRFQDDVRWRMVTIVCKYSSMSIIPSGFLVHCPTGKVILILMKFWISTFTWFQVVPFGLRFSKQFLFLMYDPSFCCP